jgi:hypothetical protein
MKNRVAIGRNADKDGFPVKCFSMRAPVYSKVLVNLNVTYKNN